jgi:hypothetical protein
MKYFFVIFLSAVVASSCQKESSTVPGMDTIDTVAQTAVLMGSFSNGPWGSVSGQVSILLNRNGAYSLALQNINISNGPDLHVYLSKEVKPINFIDLGKLRSVSGNQVYAIPGSPDFTQYKYALIHCQRYNHLFGSALLVP